MFFYVQYLFNKFSSAKESYYKNLTKMYNINNI